MSSDWKTVTLGNCCEKIGSGSTPKGGKESYQDEGTIRLIRSQNVLNDGFSSTGIVFIDEDQAKKLDAVSVQKGDVLLNITGDSVARVCQAPEAYLPARVNQHVAIIRPRPEILDAEFLRYFLVNPVQQNLMLGLASAGATRSALTKGMIEEFRVTCPAVENQRPIARFLGMLDDQITLLRETNDTLEAISEALFKSWFVDFEPVKVKAAGLVPGGIDKATAALFSDSFEESTLGSIPQGWTIRSVGDLCCTVFSGGTPDTRKPEYWGGDLRWLSSGETRDALIIDTEKKIFQVAVGNSSTRLALPGDVVIASAGQGKTRGQTAMCAVETYINQSVVSLRADPKICHSSWIFYNLRRRYEEMRMLSDSHSIRGSLTTKILSGMKVVAPPPNVIHAFGNVAGQLLIAQAANLEEIKTLTELRSTLLPRLISGKLRIPETEAAIEEMA